MLVKALRIRPLSFPLAKSEGSTNFGLEPVILLSSILLAPVVLYLSLWLALWLSYTVMITNYPLIQLIRTVTVTSADTITVTSATRNESQSEPTFVCWISSRLCSETCDVFPLRTAMDSWRATQGCLRSAEVVSHHVNVVHKYPKWVIFCIWIISSLGSFNVYIALNIVIVLSLIGWLLMSVRRRAVLLGSPRSRPLSVHLLHR